MWGGWSGAIAPDSSPRGGKVGSKISILSGRKTDFMPLRSRSLLSQIKENSVAGCAFRAVGHFCLGAPLCLLARRREA